ncbi:hypothetical protein CEXT_376091 [Caerostris extrusa]|uniref:Uncharacterized protein n=1 Tax=Caerostris extrusa TaxID=172846 RepID=A0AAV4M992_CAEEX|nr:hypothetical protein CEXT_376091 [Caerostris extrusa]
MFLTDLHSVCSSLLVRRILVVHVGDILPLMSMVGQRSSSWSRIATQSRSSRTVERCIREFFQRFRFERGNKHDVDLPSSVIGLPYESQSCGSSSLKSSSSQINFGCVMRAADPHQ